MAASRMGRTETLSYHIDAGHAARKPAVCSTARNRARVHVGWLIVRSARSGFCLVTQEQRDICRQLVPIIGRLTAVITPLHLAIRYCQKPSLGVHTLIRRCSLLPRRAAPVCTTSPSLPADTGDPA